MPELKDDELALTLDDGSEEIVKILFYYENEERGKKYYFLYKENQPDDVIVMSSVEEGKLDAIEDKEEFAEAEEVFQAYMDDPKIAEAKK